MSPGESDDSKNPENADFEKSLAESTDISSQCGDDLAAEATAYFHQLFSGHMSVDAMLEMLSRYKESSVEREKSLCECMIAKLLEEYRLFPKYPKRQLEIASTLFGSVILHRLGSSLTLRKALRLVLDALLKQPPDSKMFLFGGIAVRRFKHLLADYHQQIADHSPDVDELVTVMEQALSRTSSSNVESGASVSHPGSSQSNPANVEIPGISTSSLTSAGFVSPASGATSPKFGPAWTIGTLVVAAERAAERVEETFLSLIDSITTANILFKGNEFTVAFPQHHHHTRLAQCLVIKRASIQPNSHDLYIKFLEKVDSKLLHEEVLRYTYENCKVLLGSKLLKSSSEERDLLRNLGSWLGKLTIGRNKYVSALEIDLRSLLLEGYEKGLMIAFIPFTLRVLEPCQSSLAFMPSNPWTTQILELLAEIYSLPNLSMMHTVPIQGFFKKLGLDVREVWPTSLLKQRKREVHRNPDFVASTIIEELMK